MTRARLEEIPDGTAALRDVRYWPVDAFDDITLDELEHALRWLRAAAYSASQGAHRIQQIIDHRKASQCTSDSKPTATTTTPTPTPTPRSTSTTPTTILN